MNATALKNWLRLQALVWTPALGLVAIGGPDAFAGWHGGFAAMIGVSAMVLVLVLGSGRRIADLVTLLRLAGLVALVAIGGTAPMPWAHWLLAVAVAALDLVDGALARRFGPTEAGAVFDMEADQFAVLGMSLVAIGQGVAPHVLVLPAMRYLFVLAAWWVGVRADDPKPVDGDNRRGRLICAIVVVSLLSALLPDLSSGLRDAFTAIAVLLLAWSFASDWRHLLTRRTVSGAAG